MKRKATSSKQRDCKQQAELNKEKQSIKAKSKDKKYEQEKTKDFDIKWLFESFIVL